MKNTNEEKSEYRLYVVLKEGSETNSPQFWRTDGVSTELAFEVAGWDTWDELPGFVMLFFDNDDSALIHKDCIKSISLIPTEKGTTLAGGKCGVQNTDGGSMFKRVLDELEDLFEHRKDED